MNHELRRLAGGYMYEGWIQPSCSCGWVGRKEYAHNDHQHSNVREQEAEHAMGVVLKETTGEAQS